jgi:hypothetical protein
MFGVPLARQTTGPLGMIRGRGFDEKEMRESHRALPYLGAAKVQLDNQSITLETY